MTKPLGVILAGGRATRMGGGDKGLLPLGEGRLIDHVLERLGGQVSGIALNANGDPARFSDLGLPVIPDTLPDYPGPLAGVLAGLDWAAEAGTETIVTVAADTPFFPRDLVATLDAALRRHDPSACPRRDERGCGDEEQIAIGPYSSSDLRALARGAARGSAGGADRRAEEGRALDRTP